MAQSPERWEWRWKSSTLHVLTDNPAYRYGRAVLSIDHDADGRPYIVVSDEHAALIAAAPQMLEALEWLLNLCNGVSMGGGQPTGDEWEDALKRAEAALRKAREVTPS